MHKQPPPISRLLEGLQKSADKQHQKVHAESIKMIQGNVNDAVPYCLLATIASDYGNHTKAVELFSRSANLEPNNPYYQAYLGQALTTVGKQQAAKEAADTAAKLVIDDAHLADTIGVIYSRTGFHEKAVPFFKRAVSCHLP